MKSDQIQQLWQKFTGLSGSSPPQIHGLNGLCREVTGNCEPLPDLSALKSSCDSQVCYVLRHSLSLQYSCLMSDQPNGSQNIRSTACIAAVAVFCSLTAWAQVSCMSLAEADSKLCRFCNQIMGHEGLTDYRSCIDRNWPLCSVSSSSYNSIHYTLCAMFRKNTNVWNMSGAIFTCCSSATTNSTSRSTNTYRTRPTRRIVRNTACS